MITDKSTTEGCYEVGQLAERAEAFHEREDGETVDEIQIEIDELSGY